MPYREKKIYSGKILEVEIYPITKEEIKQPRKIKQKLTLPKQRNLNDKNAKKHLIRLLNTNFTNSDIALHLDYKDKYLPEDENGAKRDATNLIRRIKNYRKKNKLPPLRYIAVVEVGEKGKRLHHHIAISGDIDRDILEKMWTKGRANADRLKEDEFGYEGFARYISKDPKGKKRWIQSKNLKQPKVSVNDYEYRKREVEEISRYPEDRAFFENKYQGYIFTQCKVSINDINAGTYLYIKMRKLKI